MQPKPGFVPSAPTDAEADAETTSSTTESELPLGGMTVVVTGTTTGHVSDRFRTEMTVLIAKAGGRARQCGSTRPIS